MPVLHLPKNRALIAESMIILGYLKISLNASWNFISSGEDE